MSDCIRVYTPGGRKAHLLRPGVSPNSSAPSACGRWPGFGEYWRGTGAQLEHEVAANLTLCKQCERRTVRP